MKRSFAFGLLLMALLAATWDFAGAQESSFVVIVHPSNAEKTLSKSRVSQLLLKKSSRWENGTAAEPVDLNAQSPVREQVSEVIHGRSVNSIKSYWQRQIFSGKSVPPPELASDADVVAYVRGRPGAIGYVSANARLDGVDRVRLTE